MGDLLQPGTPKWHGRSRRISGFSLISAVLTCILPATALFSNEPAAKLESGPEVGAAVASFYVRAVTGPFAGKSVCYVCRNGDRPVAMVFLRELGSDVAQLLKQLDQTVNQHRADGLRCFVVLLTESSQQDAAKLQTLAFDEKIDLPLTIANESAARNSYTSISPDAAVTVILYDHLKVTRQFSFRSKECDPAAAKTVIAATEQLVKNSAP